MNHFIRKSPLLLLIAILLFGSGATAVAQTNDLTSSAEVIYGQRITFRLTGMVAAEIETIDLFLTVGQSDTPISVEVRFSQDEAGGVVAGYDLEPSLADLPPFAEVRFGWVLKTAVSPSITVPEETFTYRDDRFVWRTLTQDDVTIYWTGNDAGLSQLAGDIVAESRQTLDDILPQTAVSPLNVYIYPATSDLRTGLRLAGRDWQDGHADPSLGVLLVTAVNPLTAAAELQETIPHELTHLRLHQLASAGTLPTWYEEGIALLAAQNMDAVDVMLETAVAQDETLLLLELCTNFPKETAGGGLALAQSVSLLRYVQAQFGDQALRQIGAAYLAGAGCETGLVDALEMPLAELNADWLRAQSPQPAWRTFLNQNGLWLLLVLGSFGFLMLLLRK